MPHIHAKQILIPTGWQTDQQVTVTSDGKIASVGPQTDTPDTCVDVLLPAPVNLHSHSFQRAMAGLTEARGPDPSDSFWTWRRLMYRFLDQLTPEQVEAIAAQVFLEMLEAGYGAVAEFHYLHHAIGGLAYDNLAELSERIIAAAGQAGIGLTLLPVLYQYGGCDKRPLQGGQLRFSNDPARYARLHEAATAAIAAGPADFTIGTAPHSLRAVDQDGLRVAATLAGDRPIHMHLAEQTAEIEEVLAHRAARPTEWLLDKCDVGQNWCLIHCTHMTPNETSALAQSKAVAGLCPITESSLGDGIFNGTDYLAADGRIGVGSDSNIHISLFEELKTLEYSQRLRDRTRAALATKAHSTGRVLFDNVAAGGAQAAARPNGRISAGHLADLVGLSVDNPWLCNRSGDTLLDTAIFGGHGQDCITDVWSAGRHVVRDGQHIRRDAITQRFVRVINDLGQTI